MRNVLTPPQQPPTPATTNNPRDNTKKNNLPRTVLPWPLSLAHKQSPPRQTDVERQLLVDQSEPLLDDDTSSDDECGDYEFGDPEQARSRKQTNMKLLLSNKHLVGDKQNSTKKKWFLGCVTAAILIAVVVVIVVVTAKDSAADSNEHNVYLEDILTGRFSAHSFNGTFVSDHEILFHNHNGELVLYNVEQMKGETLLASENEWAEAIGFWVSPNRQYVLIAREYQKVFRHSFTVVCDILRLSDKRLTTIRLGTANESRLQLAFWNPHADNSLALVFENDIYYLPTPDAEPIRITSNSNALLPIYNGIPDWVYEEEIFSSNSAIWFSPDGRKLAFARFDDTPVRAMSLPVYGVPGSIEYQYPHHLGIYYPKAGSPNPIVTLYQVDLTTTPPTVVNIPAAVQVASQKPILASVTWANADSVIAVWMNRVQNEAYILQCKADACEQVWEIKSSTGWIDLFTAPTPNKDGSKLAIIQSQSQPNGDSYRHLTVITTATKTATALTSGKYVVTEILKWDPESDVIFYTANTANNSEYLHVYATKMGSPQCLTCDIVDANNNAQTYFSASISPGSSANNYIFITSSGPSIPKTMLYRLDINMSSVEPVVSKTEMMVWESNEDLLSRLGGVTLPQIEKVEIDMGNGFTAKVLMLLPHNLDRSGSTKYPMLIEVYGGPESNSVSDRWGVDWGSYMATNKSVVYVKIDGRGSGLRGDKLLHQIYRHLGTVEIEDQVTTAKLLADKYSFIDATRVAIWGWSYGGFASGMALANDNNETIHCAASVAPVTDWTYYDSIYTERYMGLPSPLDNSEGYSAARLSTMAKSFLNKNFLLIHGTLDDNVHYQQAMALVRSLERDDVPFKQITYPDEDHSLAGVRPHLYHSLGRFFGDCFGFPRQN